MQRTRPYGILFLLTFLCSSYSIASPIACQQELVKQHYKYQFANPDSAVYFLQQLRITARGNVDELLRIHNIASWFYANRHPNLDSALLHADRAIALVDHAHNRVAVAAALTKKGFVHSSRHEYKEAIHWLKKSIEYKKQWKMNDLAFSYNLLGNVYRNLDIYDKGIEYYQLALGHSTNPSADALTYKNLGKLYLQREEPKSAATMLLKAIGLYEQEGGKLKSIILCKIQLADTYLATEQTEDAIRILRECESYFLQIRKKNHLKVHMRLAKVYAKIGEWTLTEKYAQIAYSRAAEINRPHAKMKATQILVELYNERKEFAKALSYQKEYQQLRDSISYEEIRLELINQNLVDKIQENENELIILRQEKTIHRLLMLSLSLGAILLAFLISWMYRRKVKMLNQRIEKETKSKASISEALAEQKNQTRQLETELQSHIRLLSQQMEQGISSAETKVAIENLYAHRLLTEDDWADFRLLFSQVHPAFLDQLKQKATKLSNTDVKVVSLMRLNLENSEIGKMLAISPESIRKAKYRLRQKLGLANNQELQSFVFSL